MKIELISTFLPHIEQKFQGKLVSFPTLINLAALTPHDEVSIRYEHAKDIDYNVDADIIGISFIYPYADYSFEIADRFLSQGKTVVLGGPYVTIFPEKSRMHASSIVIGEAETLWPKLIEDFKKGRLQPYYKNFIEPFPSLDNLPIPRYDLVVNDFLLSQTTTATRGCPHHCDFCFMKKVTKGFRTRPIKDVIRDLQHHEGKNWIQNKVAWFWDDNLIGDRNYAKELFTQLKTLKRWWIAQVTANFGEDDELLKLAADSGCVAVYIGFESFNQENLKHINKFHNKVTEYRNIVKKIHNYGISVASGLVVGFDNDTIEVFKNSIKKINEIGIDWVNASILIPFEGTELYKKLREENRILTNKTCFYIGTVAPFKPKALSENELNEGFLKMVNDIFSLKNFIKKFKTVIKDIPFKKIGAYLIFLVVNILYLFFKVRKLAISETNCDGNCSKSNKS